MQGDVHEEHHQAVRRHGAEGLVRVPVVGRVVVQVVIAQHVVPGHAHQAEDLAERLQGVEVVEGDVAQGHPEGRVRPAQLGHDALGQVAHLPRITGLRIAAHQRFEAIAFLLRDQGEINGLGKRPGGVPHPGIAAAVSRLAGGGGTPGAGDAHSGASATRAV